MVRIISHLLWGGFLLILLFSGCDSPPDDHIEKLSRECLSRQAEMGRQSEAVARATEKLVDADAQARKQAEELHREIQEERASLDRQHGKLEDERREIAAERYWDPIVANVIWGASVLLSTILPLLICFNLLHSLYGRTARHGLDELLIPELTDPKSTLLRLPEPPAPESNQPGPASSGTASRLPAPDTSESEPGADSAPK